MKHFDFKFRFFPVAVCERILFFICARCFSHHLLCAFVLCAVLTWSSVVSRLRARLPLMVHSTHSTLIRLPFSSMMLIVFSVHIFFSLVLLLLFLRFVSQNETSATCSARNGAQQRNRNSAMEEHLTFCSATDTSKRHIHCRHRVESMRFGFCGFSSCLR